MTFRTMRKLPDFSMYSYCTASRNFLIQIKYKLSWILCSNIPGMLATCAIDKTVALWDTKNAGVTAGSKPITCGNKDMNVGKLYSLSFYQSSPWLLGCGGSGNQLALWNLASEDVFRKRFGDRLNNPEMQPVGEEKTEDFEAMMAAQDEAAEDTKKKIDSGNKNKKKGKSKKKTHKKR